jgi:hypothetical protein
MKKTNAFVSMLVVALALLGALPAAAGQATYSGSLCTPVTIAGQGNPTIYRSGRLLNQTGGDLEVVCPVQRNVAAPYFNEDMSISVTVIDQHPTVGEEVCCTATVAENDGTSITSGSACTSGSDPSPKIISINLASVYASVNGYLSLRCKLPPVYAGNSSVLSSFVVTE